MKLLAWREKPWQRRALLVLTAVALVLLAAHPELRLLIPVFDLLGIDLVVLLAGSQLLDALRPAWAAVRGQLQPLAGKSYYYFIFFFGMAGLYVGGRLGTAGQS